VGAGQYNHSLLVYAIRLASNNAQRFFRIAGMDLQT
jgi:hypothetical protein